MQELNRIISHPKRAVAALHSTQFKSSKLLLLIVIAQCEVKNNVYSRHFMPSPSSMLSLVLNGTTQELIVGAVDFGLSHPTSSPGWGHCVVFLGKTLLSQCLSPEVNRYWQIQSGLR